MLHHSLKIFFLALIVTTVAASGHKVTCNDCPARMTPCLKVRNRPRPPEFLTYCYTPLTKDRAVQALYSASTIVDVSSLPTTPSAATSAAMTAALSRVSVDLPRRVRLSAALEGYLYSVGLFVIEMG